MANGLRIAIPPHSTETQRNDYRRASPARGCAPGNWSNATARARLLFIRAPFLRFLRIRCLTPSDPFVTLRPV